MVFNVQSFFRGLGELESKGVPRAHERIHVSSRCHLNFALNTAINGLLEQALGMNQIGTTKRGIGPAYSMKATLGRFRVIDVYHESFEQRLHLLVEKYCK